MFNDEVQEVITLPSSWKVERSLNDASCQTRNISYSESATQSSYTAEIDIQTEDESSERISPRFIEDNSKALSNFLLRVYPDICEQLKENEKSHAFDGYDVNWEDEIDTITCPYTLSHKAAVQEELEVTSVTWNCRGSVIAAAYGRHDHESWCTHKSVLCTWNIEMKQLDTSKADIALEVDSCLMSIAFNPENPPIIVGGTFSGEVLIWDLSQDDDNFFVCSSKNIELHQEPITKVVWLEEPISSRARKYKLVSVSTDGRAFIWEYDHIGKSLKIEQGFLLLAASMPKGIMKSKLRGDAEMGVTCISFMKDDPDIFVLGSESGGVFKCSVNSTTIPSGITNSGVDLRSPVTLSLQPHSGPVYAVNCSPFHRNVILSCGMDATANIYSLLQMKPLFTLEPEAGYIFNAQWSQTRPLVFFLSTENGKLLIYDLKASQVKPAHSIDVNTEKMPVYAMEINSKRSQLIATGDAKGDICIWSLNDDLINFTQKEVSALENMASAMLD